jgi:hypothetical protein
MTLLFWGLLIVIVDIRTGDFDVVVDLVGWLLMVGGLWRLRDVDLWFRRARLGAIVGAIGSVAQVLPGSGVPLWLQTSVETVASTWVVFGVCTALMRTAPDAPVLVGRARTIRAADVATSAVALLLTVATGASAVTTGTSTVATGAAAVVVLLFAIVTLVVAVCFLVLVWTQRRRFDLNEPAPSPA